MPGMLETLIIMVVKIGVVFSVLLLVAAYMTWVERKVIARIQVRLGPTRVGPFGLLQPIADGIKLFFKEDLIPSQVDRALFLLAPALSVVPAMIAAAVGISWAASGAGVKVNSSHRSANTTRLSNS